MILNKKEAGILKRIRYWEEVEEKVKEEQEKQQEDCQEDQSDEVSRRSSNSCNDGDGGAI